MNGFESSVDTSQILDESAGHPVVVTTLEGGHHHLLSFSSAEPRTVHQSYGR